MGARASVSFKDNFTESPVIFNHWGGEEFHQQAKDYVEQLKKDIKEGKISPSFPLGRLEAAYVMVDFIRHITKGQDRIISSLYLCRKEEEGDNSDYGHETICLTSSLPPF